MGKIRLIKNYEVNGFSFEINTSLSTTSEYLVTFIKYDGKIQSQINVDYINAEELAIHYDKVYEICGTIAERESGWKNVVNMLLQDGFKVDETN
jgi:hypothetical protein